MRTADVFVNIPVKSIAKAYTYCVPSALSFVDVGWRVYVPFSGRRVEGFVVSTADQTEKRDIPLKDILAVVDDESWFTPEMLKAAKWLASFYLCSLAEMMRLFMPGKSGLKITLRYAAKNDEEGNALLAMPACRSVYDCLCREGAQKKTELKKKLPAFEDDLDHVLEKLLRHRLICREYEATKREVARYEEIISLCRALSDADMQSFRRKPAQEKLLRFLMEKGAQTRVALRKQHISYDTIRRLCLTGYIKEEKRRVLRDSYQHAQANHAAIVLTDDQKEVLSAIIPSLEANRHRKFLLKGVTGSGKTQVYIELARHVRMARRRVVVLVPEIALTGQVVMAFKAYFPQDLVVIHSRLSLAERNDAVLRVRRGEAGVVIGARSALFTPVENIGLIIMDEEQDMSYKQDESPRYHARVVAEVLAKLHHAVLLLGSATPSMESCFRTKTGEITFLSMPHRVGDVPLPHASCVDMRKELRSGNRGVLSRALRTLIESTIQKGEQAIIMLNRRGFSTFVLCRDCGEVLRCKNCGLPLVFHTNGHLVCHHCDTHEPVPDVCPKCGSRRIRYFGSGTEKLEQELHALMPAARIIRMDRDTTTAKFSHQNILDAFRNQEYDILLGTQMVAKGHDIPNVTAVGIISADAALNVPDFRAAERCFMLITQTAGRAGRHGTRGNVIIQAYNPDHYAITCGIAQDYEHFYEREIALREELFYPPISRMVKLLYQNTDKEIAEQEARAFIDRFREVFKSQAEEKGRMLQQNQIIGPSPAMVACFRGTYRFVVLIKTRTLAKVQEFLREEGLHLQTNVAIDIDPITMF